MKFQTNIYNGIQTIKVSVTLRETPCTLLIQTSCVLYHYYYCYGFRGIFKKRKFEQQCFGSFFKRSNKIELRYCTNRRLKTHCCPKYTTPITSIWYWKNDHKNDNKHWPTNKKLICDMFYQGRNKHHALESMHVFSNMGFHFSYPIIHLIANRPTNNRTQNQKQCQCSCDNIKLDPSWEVDDIRTERECF